jgi:hypothetical protein
VLPGPGGQHRVSTDADGIKLADRPKPDCAVEGTIHERIDTKRNEVAVDHLAPEIDPLACLYFECRKALARGIECRSERRLRGGEIDRQRQIRCPELTGRRAPSRRP